MALKYWLEFTDVKEVVNRVEILNEDFTDDATQIYGYCSLTKSSTKDTLEVVRSGGLKIELEANLDLNLSDLYSEVERTYQVIYYRDGNIIFNGWLDTDGLYESYVTDKWKISLTATDGLGYLTNLSYVDNTTKKLIYGKKTQLETIVNCLKRTNLDLDIYINIDIKYFLSDINLSILDQATINNYRFIKDDKAIDCLSVLKATLELYTACITQKDGKWFIYRPNDLTDDTNRRYFKFDADGVALSPETEYIDISQDLGSQVDGFYPHHVNTNQQISIDASVGAYRINYKYGATNSLFENIQLENVSGVIDEWTINDATKLTFPTNNKGFVLESVRNIVLNLILTSESVSLLEGNIIKHLGKIINLGSPLDTRTSSFRFKVVLVGASTYYLDIDGTWSTSSKLLGFLPEKDREYSYEILAQPLPIDGDLKIELYSPQISSGGATYDSFYQVNESTISVHSNLGKIDGELHTFERIEKPSTKIAETKEVYNGDSESELYVGTIYESDGETPTVNWTVLSSVYNGSLIEIMGKERLKMYNKPLKVFKGDVFGYVDYLSVISINNISGKFMPIEYEYNAKTNVCKLKLKEILNDDILSDIEYDISYYEGEVEEPTITN